MSACQLTIETVRERLGDRLLKAGSHTPVGPPEDCDVCVRELRAWLCDLPWNDHPDSTDGYGASATDKVCQGLNDASWSSDKARTKYCLPLACLSESDAPAGWIGAMTEQVIRQIVPIALRAAASIHPDETHKDAMNSAAGVCEAEGTYKSAKAAAYATTYAATNATYAATRATSAATNSANYAANSAASAATNATYAATRATSAAAYAANYAANSAYADSARDRVLALAVKIVLVAHGRADLVVEYQEEPK